MRILVCGSRDWTSLVGILTVLHRYGSDDTIVHGACRGADMTAAYVAKSQGIKEEAYPADWKKYGKAAGPIRNQEMLDSGVDLVIAFHPNISQSKGTKDMVARAEQAGIETEVYVA